MRAAEAAQDLEQEWEEDQTEYDCQRKEEEHRIWTRMVRLPASWLGHAVEAEERQKTRPWIWQAEQGHWRTFRRRQSEEEHGTWAEGVKERAEAKVREMVVSLVRRPF